MRFPPSRILVGLVAILAVVTGLAASPAAAQGFSPIPKVAAAFKSSVVVIKGSPGVLQWASCSNTNASVEFIQVFDTIGSVTVGTTPPSSIIPIQASGVTNFVVPTQFLFGIKAIPTTTPTGNTAPSTALDCAFGFN